MRKSLFAVVAIALAIALSTSVAAMRQTVQEDQPVAVESPQFELLVYQVQDPYLGAITVPAELDPEMRYIGAEVAIINESDTPLTTGRSYVRIRDVDGRDHIAGSVIGSESSPLQNRVLAKGEQMRGWVWYAVPADVEISQIYIVTPALESALPWDDAPVGPPADASPVGSPEASPELALPEGSERETPDD